MSREAILCAVSIEHTVGDTAPQPDLRHTALRSARRTPEADTLTIPAGRAEARHMVAKSGRLSLGKPIQTVEVRGFMLLDTVNLPGELPRHAHSHATTRRSGFCDAPTWRYSVRSAPEDEPAASSCSCTRSASTPTAISMLASRLTIIECRSSDSCGCVTPGSRIFDRVIREIVSVAKTSTKSGTRKYLSLGIEPENRVSKNSVAKPIH